MKRASLLIIALPLAACDGGTFQPHIVDDTGEDGGGDDGGTTDGGTDGGGTDGGGTDGGTDDGGTDGGTDGGADGGGTDGGTDSGGAEAVDYCHIQYPCSMTGAAGGTSDSVYVWVYEEGVTQGSGAGSGIEVDVGVGADGSEPSGPGWTWTTAAWFADKDGLTPGDLSNDEYATTFRLPDTAGSYDYAARVRVAGGPWLYCDLAENDGNLCPGAGSDDGYSSADAGALVVD